MTTVINNPGEGSNDNSSGMGIIFGVIIAIILIALFFVYGLPALRRTNQAQPSGPTINVPETIDINVNK